MKNCTSRLPTIHPNKISLEKLRRDDPEKFQRIVGRHQQLRKQKMADICREDYWMCAELTQRRHQTRQARLEILKQRDPEAYQRLIARIKEKREARGQDREQVRRGVPVNRTQSEEGYQRHRRRRRGRRPQRQHPRGRGRGAF